MVFKASTNEGILLPGVTLRFIGRSQVRWPEVERVNGKNRNRIFKNDEVYFEREIFIFGTGSPTRLEAGIYDFRFDFSLPGNIPSSFEGSMFNTSWPRYCNQLRSGTSLGSGSKARAEF